MWNKYKIGNYWFNIDFTSADTSRTITTFSHFVVNPNYIAFKNDNYTTSRDYYKNWYEAYPETTYNIQELANTVVFNKNSFNIRKSVINDKWYYFEKGSKNLYSSKYDLSYMEIILTLNSDKYINNGIWQLGDRLYFADFNQLNQHVIKYYDVNTKQEHEIFCTNKEFAHF